MKKFSDYYKELSHEAKVKLAQSLDTSLAYLSQLANDHRKPGRKILISIRDATNGEVTPESFD